MIIHICEWQLLGEGQKSKKETEAKKDKQPSGEPKETLKMSTSLLEFEEQYTPHQVLQNHDTAAE